eukprot:g4340.t1
MWAHKCGLRLDEKHRYIEHHGYPFDAVFAVDSENKEVYDSLVAPIVQTQKESGTVIVFGQTGTGKTYTLTAIARLAVTEILQSVTKELVTISVVEIAGDTVTDLTTSKKIVLRSSKCGSTNLIGIKENVVNNCEDAVKLLDTVFLARSTHSTEMNDTSSRTHLVCRVQRWSESMWERKMKRIETEAAKKQQMAKEAAEIASAIAAGTLTQEEADIAANKRAEADMMKESEELLPLTTLDLVDLAGSEWAGDQRNHDAERQKESKQINKSLLTLKQCLRFRATVTDKTKKSKKRAPIRESKLTRVISNAFSPTSSVVVIATLCPASDNLEHSMNTLARTSPYSSCAIQRKKRKKKNEELDSLQVENGISGEVVITTNVPGIALSKENENDENLIDKNTAADEYSEKNPVEWNATECCVFWVESATESIKVLQQEMAAKIERENVPSPCFTITIDASSSIAIGKLKPDKYKKCFARCNGGSRGKTKAVSSFKLGIKFENNAIGLPIVTQLLPGGILSRLKQKNELLKSGIALFGINEKVFPLDFDEPTQDVLREFKVEAMKLSKAVKAWRSWKLEETKEKEVKKPDPFSITLQFVEAKEEEVRFPRIPRVFTGESRLGIKEGPELCAEYGSANFEDSKFRFRCKDLRLAKMMWKKLRTAMVKNKNE